MNAARILGLAVGSALLVALPAFAQVSDSNVHAVYVPAQCMFETGNGGGSCLVQNNNQGYFFRFLGGSPGWQQYNQPAPRLTDIQVSPDGRSMVNVSYNGAPR